MSSSENSDNPEKHKGDFWNRICEDNEIVVRHAIGMAVTIMCIWVFHCLLKVTLGEDAKLYGYIPLIYLAHTGDLLAIVRFYLKLVKEF